jgi:hypothetical protein
MPRFEADSHIACRAVPLPCRDAKRLECVFPIWFTQCGRIWFAPAMPCPCHAPTLPFFSRPRHSTAVGRRPVGYLPAFGFFRLPRGVPRRLLSEAYQSSSQRSISTTAKSRSSTLQKRRSVKVRIFPATTRTFTKDKELSGHGTGAAWHVWINGTAWQVNGIITAFCVNRPLVSSIAHLKAKRLTNKQNTWRTVYSEKLILHRLPKRYHIFFTEHGGALRGSPHTEETRVRFRGSLCRICGGQGGARTGFPRRTSVFPCQYHSTNASCPFVYLSTTQRV